MQGESGIGEALVAWAEGFREGSLEVEHSTKGSGGDFLMVLMPFFFSGRLLWLPMCMTEIQSQYGGHRA